MKTLSLILILTISLMLSLPSLSTGQPAGSDASAYGEDGGFLAASPASDEEIEVQDPLQPLNRAFFHFNDKLYFWVLKPVAKGYDFVMPDAGQKGVRNFFSNLTAPVRIVNCLLQAKFASAGNETARFGINTTLGVLGFCDPAFQKFEIRGKREDLGQTLGLWGLGPCVFINWPILGPSNLRDTVGFVGDYFLDPVNYFPPANVAARAVERVNSTSLSLGEYEDFKRSAIDPYIAMRQAYMQYRQYQVGR